MSKRFLYGLGFFIVCLLLLTGMYIQKVDGFNPCPLCMLQRFVFALLGLFFLIGVFVHKQKIISMVVDMAAFLLSLAGIFFAGRQIWLQHFLPPDANECGVSIQYMLQVLPFHEVLVKIFQGSAECTQDGWRFLFLNMAEWSMIWFVFFLIFSFYLICSIPTIKTSIYSNR